MADGGRETGHGHRARTDRLHRRLVADAALVVVIDIHAIDIEPVISRTFEGAPGGRRGSAKCELRAHGVRATRIDVGLRVSGDARRERHDRGEVAAIQRQLFHLPRGDVGIDTDLISFEPIPCEVTVTVWLTEPVCNLKS